MPINQSISNSHAWVDQLPVDQSPWAKLARHVFWDRDVKLENWRKGIQAAHPSYLPQSILRMNAKDFIRFYGREAFVKDWPEIVNQISDREVRFKALLLDLKWSILVANTYDLIPCAGFWKLGPRCREFLVFVSAHPGINIYQAAKSLNMHYRRAHDYAKVGLETGMFFATEEIQLGRRQRRLWPNPRWPA